MEISLSNKFAFVAVPKTAGDSMHRALKPYGTDGVWRTNRGEWKHATARRIRKEFLKPPRWGQFFTFAFVRNPWDWMASKWRYNQMMRDHLAAHPEEVTPDVQAWHDRLVATAGDDFATFVANHCKWLDNGLYRRWCCDAHGRQLVRFVGRFETLQADWAQICERIGLQLDLPHENETLLDGQPRPHFRGEYDDATRELVAAAFADDIARFGYTFDD